MCKCVNVSFGSYDNQVLLQVMSGPKTFEKKFAAIDTCIASEIGYLWHQGVKTLNSCCGHNKCVPTVIVDEESVSLMKSLGYESQADIESRNETASCRSVRPETTFYLKG